jgi:ATP-binding protein involved in chromosome partitioning
VVSCRACWANALAYAEQTLFPQTIKKLSREAIVIDQNEIKKALESVADVGGNGTIVDQNRIEELRINDGVVKLRLSLPAASREERDRIEDNCFDAITALDGVKDVLVVTAGQQTAPEGQPAQAPPPSDSPFAEQAPIPGVKHIIAVASGKGGVGKSTVCVNLALALKQRGARVGLLDADVYGPSLQVLLGVTEQPQPGQAREIAPVEKHGLKLMSLGFLTAADTPAIWRGPMVMGVIKKFLTDVDWGELDYLMVDLPPGTGDAQLTLVQTVPITGAIIVTTPSAIALVDAQKGLRMFEQVDVPVIGIVENMSTFVCPHCGETTDIFDAGGGARIGRATEVEILGQIPLDPRVRSAGDKGEPYVDTEIDSPIAKAFLTVADRIRDRYPAGVR